MKYISLFTGIGGFEVAIENVFPDAECIGYSEVKPDAIKVYEDHFPNHKNFGDISELKEHTIRNLVKEKGCDIIFGGFPCTNLSSLAGIQGDNSGLEGKKSSLFYDMIRVIKIVNDELNTKVHVIFENNYSMSNKNKQLILDLIKEEYPEVYMTVLNGSEFGVQSRKRIFWTDFPVNKDDIVCEQTWDDVLDHVGKNPNISDNYLNCLNKHIPTKIKNKSVLQVVKENNEYKFKIIEIDDVYKSRWQMSFHSDTGTVSEIPYSYPSGKCRPITASFGNHNVLVDRRNKLHGKFDLRMFSFEEMEKLFGFSEGYTKLITNSKQKRKDLLGNTVIVNMVSYVFCQLLEYYM
jgi:DNA-cytosine methyltransferase